MSGLYGEAEQGKVDFMKGKELVREKFITWSGMGDLARGSIPRIEAECKGYIARLEQELQSLQVERNTIERAKFTPGEVEKSAIERIRELRRQHFVNGPLKHHMRQVQSGLTHAFERGACFDMVHDRELWRLVLSVVTEQDIKEACAGLPEGMTKKEREKALADIDAKIHAVEAKLERGIDKEALTEILGFAG